MLYNRLPLTQSFTMVKTSILLLGFLVIFSKITLGQLVSDFPCPDYPTVRDVYVPGTDNYHEFIHKSIICDLTEYPSQSSTDGVFTYKTR